MASVYFLLCSRTTQVWTLQAWMIVPKSPRPKTRVNPKCPICNCLQMIVSPGLHISCLCKGYDLPATSGRDSSPISGMVGNTHGPVVCSRKGRKGQVWVEVGGV